MELNQTQEIQQITLKMLEEFTKYLEHEKINYFLIGGGLIGAKRHNGFIPWDDDIDICIPRPDYERLLSLKAPLPSPYEISHWGNDPDYIYPYAKLYDTSTTLVEDFVKPFKRGVWIDIFPIDGTFENCSLRRLHFFTARIIKFILNISSGAISKHRKISHPTILNVIGKTIPSTVLKKIISKILILKDFENSTYAANIFGRWGVKESTPTRVFKNLTYVKFENIEIRTMLEHEIWLRNIYGDYMTPPPKEFQKSDHLGVQIDLNNGFKDKT